jgi:hypothetical protein
MTAAMPRVFSSAASGTRTPQASSLLTLTPALLYCPEVIVRMEGMGVMVTDVRLILRPCKNQKDL